MTERGIDPRRLAIWDEIGFGTDWELDDRDADPYRNLHGPGRAITVEQRQHIRYEALRASILRGVGLARTGLKLKRDDPLPDDVMGQILSVAKRYVLDPEATEVELSAVLEAIYVRVLHAAWADGLEGVDLWRAHAAGLLGEQR